jgi:hypothetical protein
LDNIAAKALYDLPAKHRVITDDAMVVKSTAYWAEDVAPGMIQGTIEPAAPSTEKFFSRKKSNRQVAKAAGVDKNTVTAVRAELEEIGEKHQSERVERKGGGSYLAKKAPKKRKPKRPSRRAALD